MNPRIAPQPDGSWLVLTGGGSVDFGGGLIGMKRSTIVAACPDEASAERIVKAIREAETAMKERCAKLVQEGLDNPESAQAILNLAANAIRALTPRSLGTAAGSL
jgi:hypothetical protein